MRGVPKRMNRTRLASLFASFVSLAAGCAGQHGAPDAHDPPRTLAPLQGDLASADAPTLDAACAQHLASVRQKVAALRATPRPVAARDVARVLEAYDEANAELA